MPNISYLNLNLKEPRLFIKHKRLVVLKIEINWDRNERKYAYGAHLFISFNSRYESLDIEAEDTSDFHHWIYCFKDGKSESSCPHGRDFAISYNYVSEFTRVQLEYSNLNTRVFDEKSPLRNQLYSLIKLYPHERFPSCFDPVHTSNIISKRCYPSFHKIKDRSLWTLI